MTSFTTRVMVVAILAASVTTTVWSQTPVTIPTDKAATPWEVPIETLKQNLKGPTLEEMKVELDAWRDALKTQTVAIAAGGGDAAALKENRKKTRDRFDRTLKAYVSLGGDGAPYEKYRDHVMSEKTGVREMVTATTDWLKSPDGGLAWAIKIIGFLVTLFVFKILSNVAGRIMGKAVATLKNTSELLRDFFVNATKKIVSLIGVVVALSMLGVNVAPFLAAIGAIGFIIAFALQGTLSNFAAGVMILLYRPYDIGVVVTASGVTGKVSAMSLVSTTLKTPDNQTVIVPNGKIWGDVITNVTGSDTRRVDMVFGIGYSDDIDKAHSVLERVVNAHALVLKDPAPVIKVSELADSSVNFIVRPWSKTSDYWDVYWDLTRTVKEEFDKEGISIPFPQQDVHMHQVEA